MKNEDKGSSTQKQIRVPKSEKINVQFFKYKLPLNKQIKPNKNLKVEANP